MKARNAEYNPKRFSAVIMRIRDPKTTALIFSSGFFTLFHLFDSPGMVFLSDLVMNGRYLHLFAAGKMVCTGAKSEADCRLACRKYARIVQKLGFPETRFDPNLSVVRALLACSVACLLLYLVVVQKSSSASQSFLAQLLHSNSSIFITNTNNQTSFRFSEFTIQNMVASCDVRFPIRLEGLSSFHEEYSSYEPELFPGSVLDVRFVLTSYFFFSRPSTCDSHTIHRLHSLSFSHFSLSGLIYRMVEPKIVLLIFVSGKVVLTGAKTREQIFQAFETIYPTLVDFRKDAKPTARNSAGGTAPAGAAAAAAGAAGTGGDDPDADDDEGGGGAFGAAGLSLAAMAAHGGYDMGDDYGMGGDDY